MSDDALAEQRRLYGEPVGDLVRRIAGRLSLSQAAVARVLGLSPAMLSQLMSGQRTKIGNPQVLTRLQALHELAGTDPLPTGEDLDRRLAEIADSQTTITTAHEVSPAEGAAAVRRVLRSAGSARDLERAAKALDKAAPGVAEVLRVYGSGSEAQAEAHFRSLRS